MAIPAFINSRAEGADEISRVLDRAGGFQVHRHEPAELRDSIQRVVNGAPPRILVAGGDGSLCTAAGVIAETEVELAIIAGGTLNHFATDLGIPADMESAVRLAQRGNTRMVDIARVNGAPFLNTGSVGAYVAFVKLRERFEPALGYRAASLLSAGRLLFRLRSSRVTLEVEGVSCSYTTPLVFIGVGERELKLPSLGSRVEGGQQGLHVMVVRQRSGARVLALALAAAARGVKSVAQTPALDSFIVNRCIIETSHRTIALDGELVRGDGRLEIEIVARALRVVVP